MSERDSRSLELNEASRESYEKADAQLNRIYNRILNDHAGDKNFVEKLKAAERAWIIFRDAQVNSIFYGDEQTRGSMHPTCNCMVLKQLTDDRIEMLRDLAAGRADMCSGGR